MANSPARDDVEKSRGPEDFMPWTASENYYMGSIATYVSTTDRYAFEARVGSFHTPNNNKIPDTDPAADSTYWKLISLPWANTTNYFINDYVKGSDTELYKAMTDNIDMDPIAEVGTHWELISL